MLTWKVTLCELSCYEPPSLDYDRHPVALVQSFVTYGAVACGQWQLGDRQASHTHVMHVEAALEEG